MFKKVTRIGLYAALAAGLLVGCGQADEANEGGFVPETLTVQFVPSQSAETLEAKAKPLEDLLSERLGIPVKVSISTDYNTVVEAMGSKQVDVGFLPPTTYVLAAEQGAAEVILQAQRNGVNDDGSFNDDLVDYYKSMILVREDSDIQSVEDLKGKRIAWQNVTSSAGYVWPAGYLLDNDIDPEKDVQGVTVKGHDTAVISLINNDVDAAAVFQDARNNVVNDLPEIFEQTRVLFFTEAIPNDTIAVRPDMSPEWKEKIADAFIAIGQDPEGQQIIFDIYSHRGYAKSEDSKFDVVRRYTEAILSRQ
jgi:phosphonate transport system substrate-binding protein